MLVKNLGEWTLFLDPHLRKVLSSTKRRAWIQNQHFHPQERKHSFLEVIEWFDKAGFSFVSSIPKISSPFTADENLFAPQDTTYMMTQNFVFAYSHTHLPEKREGNCPLSRNGSTRRHL